MNRRNIFSAGVALATTGFVARAKAAELPQQGALPTGPVTLYYEFRVALPENALALSSIQKMAASLMDKPGFLHLTLKQMTGDSTMVKNYPESYKGILATAYLDGVSAQRQPYYYALFIRFSDYQALLSSGANEAFGQQIVPHLHSISPSPNGAVKSKQPMAWYQGVFETIAAGNRSAIVQDNANIISFLRMPADAHDLTSVANHVFINDSDHLQFDQNVVALLRVAQETYLPADAANGIGSAGAADNRLYRKAVTTEILRNAFPDGTMRAYLMHGVWDSVWDHENSHLDARFQKAAGPVGAAVTIGPVEPFYQTRLSVSAS
ncbi:hypothetical protein [Acidocella aquatica]|nr:hypothetical protein [Acidocella aquatica]